MISNRYIKLVISTLVILSVFFLTGAGQTWAFSVDVDNLEYTDTSGPREIDYDFSDGTYGGTLPPNSIELPSTAIIQKNAVDLSFMFGVMPEVGNATLSAPNGVGTVTTSTEGVVILTGSSSTKPPLPSDSWTYSLALKNFSGVTDATKKYRFEIGAAVPPSDAASPQPRFRGEWDSSGNLLLQAAIK